MAKVDHKAVTPQVRDERASASSQTRAQGTKPTTGTLASLASLDVNETDQRYPRRLSQLRMLVSQHAPLALAREERLSRLRMDLGRAQMLGSQAPEIMGCDADYLAGLPKEIERLEDEAETQACSPEGSERVLSARFVIFLERIHALEKGLGRSDTLKLARRVFYNRGGGDRWVKTSGLRALTAAEIQATGIPHGAHNFPVYQDTPMFLGEMRVPLSLNAFESEAIDIGHVLAGLDYAEHKGEHPNFIRTKSWPLVPNLVGRNEVTWIGDLASATVNTLTRMTAEDALAYESTSDWKANFDAIAMAGQGARGGSLTNTLLDYYFPSDRKTGPNRFRRHEGFLKGQSHLSLKAGQVKRSKYALVGLISRITNIAAGTSGGSASDYKSTAERVVDAFIKQVQAGYDAEQRPASTPPKQ